MVTVSVSLFLIIEFFVLYDIICVPYNQCADVLQSPILILKLIAVSFTIRFNWFNFTMHIGAVFNKEPALYAIDWCCVQLRRDCMQYIGAV